LPLALQGWAIAPSAVQSYRAAFGAGETQQQALENITEAIELYLQTAPQE
jgi:predicted RNase H-like HicB family nuclease